MLIVIIIFIENSKSIRSFLKTCNVQNLAMEKKAYSSIIFYTFNNRCYWSFDLFFSVQTDEKRLVLANWVVKHASFIQQFSFHDFSNCDVQQLGSVERIVSGLLNYPDGIIQFLRLKSNHFCRPWVGIEFKIIIFRAKNIF